MLAHDLVGLPQLVGSSAIPYPLIEDVHEFGGSIGGLLGLPVLLRVIAIGGVEEVGGGGNEEELEDGEGARHAMILG